MCLYVYWEVRVSSLHHLKVLWYLCMFIHVHSASKSASSLLFLSVEMSSESLPSLSEGFGTGGVGDGVRHWFLWVAAVVVNLEQDGEVHEDLQQATCPELHRSLGEQEVDRFKGVAAGPHQHHLDAGRNEWEKEAILLKLLIKKKLFKVTHYHENVRKQKLRTFLFHFALPLTCRWLRRAYSPDYQVTQTQIIP